MKKYRARFTLDSGDRVTWFNLTEESVITISRHIANKASFVELRSGGLPENIIFTKNITVVEFSEEK